MNNKVRLLPVLAAVALGTLAIKAVSIAEAAGENAAKANKEKAAEKVEHQDDKTEAKENVDLPPPVTSDENKENSDKSCPAPDFLAEQAGLSQYEIKVLRSLSERREELDSREKKLDTRELTVSAAELRLNDQIEKLQTLESSIDGLLKKLEDKNNEQLASLVKVYESMKPKDAARIFDTLDNDLMLSLADKMKPAVMAAILSNMSSDRARTLTQLMAQKTEPPETVTDLEKKTNGQ